MAARWLMVRARFAHTGQPGGEARVAPAAAALAAGAMLERLLQEAAGRTA